MFSDRKALNVFIKNLHVTSIPWDDNIYFMKWHTNKIMLVSGKVTADIMTSQACHLFSVADFSHSWHG